MQALSYKYAGTELQKRSNTASDIKWADRMLWHISHKKLLRVSKSK
jgi:hypothetical protein